MSAARGPAGRRRTEVRAAQRRRNTLLLAATVGLVVIVVAAFIVLDLTSRQTSDTSSRAASGAEYAQLASVPVASLAGAADGYSLTAAGGTYPTVVHDPVITVGGKPEMLYMGAEYCPFCATERWPLVVALSKFGTFDNLRFIHSDDDPGETYRNVPTLSFYKSTYSSRWLTFIPVEEQTVTGAQLQKPTPAESALLARYDAKGDIPFVDMGGRATIVGAEYSPTLLIGKSFGQITSSIAGGTSPLAESVQADAGSIVSDICRMTDGRPGSVCRSFPAPITR